MNTDEIRQIQEQIQSLPRGNITIKRINGKEYEYWQYRENGRQVTRRVKGEELDTLQAKIEERKRLENLLKTDSFPSPSLSERPSSALPHHPVPLRIGDDLRAFAEPVRKYQRRDIYDQLEAYVYGPSDERVCVLYGPRRSGKTTLIRQVILSMPPKMQEKTAFLQNRPGEPMARMIQSLEQLEAAGFHYVFFDEVTSLDDFLKEAPLLSDIFAASGMKIVLSGPDALGFLFEEEESLKGRYLALSTSFVPYRETERVFGISEIDQYIQFDRFQVSPQVEQGQKEDFFLPGQNMVPLFDHIFSSLPSSFLKSHQNGGSFSSLYELVEQKGLALASGQVVNDIICNLVLDVLRRVFSFSDLGAARESLRNSDLALEELLDTVDTWLVVERFQALLVAQKKGSENLTEEQIRELFYLLGRFHLIWEVEEVSFGNEFHSGRRTIFTHPGFCYERIKEQIHSLMQEKEFQGIPYPERVRIMQRILDKAKERMIEDILLQDTQVCHPELRVLLHTASGQRDMIFFHPHQASCELFEICHRKEPYPSTDPHLTDPSLLRSIEHHYGPVTNQGILYMGPTLSDGEKRYVNIEEYLRGLSSF